MQIEQSMVMIPTPDGQMPAFLFVPPGLNPKPAVLLLMEAFGLTSHIQEVATRIANEDYVVLTPDLYYRELPNHTFSYDEVEQAMAMMYRLDFGEPIVADLQAALGQLKSRPDVNSSKVGVTGFCLGGGLTFLTACALPGEMAVAAPFYGMVLDEWIEAMPEIKVPM
jgi:carboxymethylenebutenolidase